LEFEHSRKEKDADLIKYLEKVKEHRHHAHKRIEVLFPGAEVTKDEFTKALGDKFLRPWAVRQYIHAEVTTAIVPQSKDATPDLTIKTKTNANGTQEVEVTEGGEN